MPFELTAEEKAQIVTQRLRGYHAEKLDTELSLVALQDAQDNGDTSAATAQAIAAMQAKIATYEAAIKATEAYDVNAKPNRKARRSASKTKLTPVPDPGAEGDGEPVGAPAE